VQFKWGHNQLTTRILQGQFPNYRQLIPNQFAHAITINRSDFLQSLSRIKVLAKEKNNVVSLVFSGVDQLVGMFCASDVGDGHEELKAQITGDGIEISFNITYLIQGLKAFSSTDVVLRCNTPTSPAVIEAVSGLKMTYLLMPIQVRS
jgi:DNA polymerase-3 subunit beta